MPRIWHQLFSFCSDDMLLSTSISDQWQCLTLKANFFIQQWYHHGELIHHVSPRMSNSNSIISSKLFSPTFERFYKTSLTLSHILIITDADLSWKLLTEDKEWLWSDFTFWQIHRWPRTWFVTPSPRTKNKSKTPTKKILASPSDHSKILHYLDNIYWWWFSSKLRAFIRKFNIYCCGRSFLPHMAFSLYFLSLKKCIQAV